MAFQEMLLVDNSKKLRVIPGIFLVVESTTLCGSSLSPLACWGMFHPYVHTQRCTIINRKIIFILVMLHIIFRIKFKLYLLITLWHIFFKIYNWVLIKKYFIHFIVRKIETMRTVFLSMKAILLQRKLMFIFSRHLDVINKSFNQF